MIMNENQPSSQQATKVWKPEDLTFAAAELSREFLDTTPARVAAAVDSAAVDIPPMEGRVKLLQSARRFLRTL
jgi:hypothetical protein